MDSTDTLHLRIEAGTKIIVIHMIMGPGTADDSTTN